MSAALVEPTAIRVIDARITPLLIVAGVSLTLDVFNLVTIPLERLGPAVASLADEDSRTKLVRAMDELLSQA